MTENVTWMSVTEILQTVEGSVDFDMDDYLSVDEFWTDMLMTKCSDTGFGKLVDSIIEHGFKPEGAIGWDDCIITEGHHRLAAAILLCLDEIPTTPYGSSWRNPGSYESRINAHWNDDPEPIYLH